MQPRLDYTKASPGTVRALFGLEVYLHGCGLEHGLLHLVKLRASQINGCAYCIDMHSKDARAAGETEQRLYLLDAWREVPFYSDRERAAFAWTEAVTKVTEGHVPDAVFEGGPRAVQRRGAHGPDHGDRRDQRLEPDGDQLPLRAGDVQARAPGPDGGCGACGQLMPSRGR